MAKAPLFQVGDSVRVNVGILCPDDDSLSLAGWQGRVTAIYPEEETFELDWDSKTLKNIPDRYIRNSEIEGLGWGSMVLMISEVSLATPQDTKRETEAQYKQLMAIHRWDSFSKSNPGISELLGPLGDCSNTDCLDAWEKYLGEKLTFPFKATREEQVRRGPVEVGEIVEVIGIDFIDDIYGIYVKVKLAQRTYSIPLCDLEATKSSSSNYQALKDYVVWFANR